jgi:membrane protease YdiL (CAAX protease family)
VPPVFEPPGNFHPPISKRPFFSLAGRSSPRLYLLGLTVGLPGIAALLLYLVAHSAGFKLGLGSLTSWILVEAVSVLASVGLIGWAIAQGRQRRADGWRDYNGPSPFLMIGAFLALTTALELILAAVLEALNVDVNSAPSTLVELLVYLAAYIGLVQFLTVRTGALTWRDMVRPRQLAPSADDWDSSVPRTAWAQSWAMTLGSWRTRILRVQLGDLLVPLALVLPLLVASSLTSAGLLLVLGLNNADINPDPFVPTTGLDRLLIFITVAVIAPIGEEIFFRGFATNAWGRSISRNSAVIRASLFFAFIHVMNTATTDAGVSWRVALFNFGARVPVAFALTWLYMRRRSMLSSGTLHAGYNGLITLISNSLP